MSAVTSETRLVYVVEGEPSVGTLAEYAETLEMAHYSSCDVSPHVWAFAPDRGERGDFVRLTPSFETTGFDASDFSTTTVRLGDAETSFRIDGRA